MIRTLAACLIVALREVRPDIETVSIGDRTQRATWRVGLARAPGATDEQHSAGVAAAQAAVQSVINGFIIEEDMV